LEESATPPSAATVSFVSCSAHGYSREIKSFLVLFFKKELLSLFFSEEKNQKTFVPALVTRYGRWPDIFVMDTVKKVRLSTQINADKIR
jgi:hypothetical protein